MPQTSNPSPEAPLAFVTGATGLLGNNLTRELLAEGWRVRALVRSPEKAKRQLDGLEVEIVQGDMQDPAGFASALADVRTIFHTAAHFRDAYAGGSHGRALEAVNVEGLRGLLDQAFRAGVRRFVQTSSIAVLRGEPGELVDESMLREEKDADDYYRSKILADRALLDFLKAHPDFHAVMVLPGWMHGPGDAGPTSAGQTVLDVALERLPGIPPGSFAVVDARDVARALILANRQGRRGERYLAAGRHMAMAELIPMIGAAAGVKPPSRRLPLALLRLIAFGGEVAGRATGRPVLLSRATVRIMAAENERSRFDPSKSARELGLSFRPLEETLRDEIAWFRAKGLLS